MNDDRRRQVATRKARYGDDTYVEMGKKSQTFKKHPQIAKKAAMKRWHPELFNNEGDQIKEVT